MSKNAQRRQMLAIFRADRFENTSGGNINRFEAKSERRRYTNYFSKTLSQNGNPDKLAEVVLSCKPEDNLALKYAKMFSRELFETSNSLIESTAITLPTKISALNMMLAGDVSSKMYEKAEQRGENVTDTSHPIHMFQGSTSKYFGFNSDEELGSLCFILQRDGEVNIQKIANFLSLTTAQAERSAKILELVEKLTNSQAHLEELSEHINSLSSDALAEDSPAEGQLLTAQEALIDGYENGTSDLQKCMRNLFETDPQDREENISTATDEQDFASVTLPFIVTELAKGGTTPPPFPFPEKDQQTHDDDCLRQILESYLLGDPDSPFSDVETRPRLNTLLTSMERYYEENRETDNIEGLARTDYDLVFQELGKSKRIAEDFPKLEETISEKVDATDHYSHSRAARAFSQGILQRTLERGTSLDLSKCNPFKEFTAKYGELGENTNDQYTWALYDHFCSAQGEGILPTSIKKYLDDETSSTKSESETVFARIV